MWYAKSDAFDADIRSRFETHAIDLAGALTKPPHLWEDTPESTLALIIALDQFSRNMYRGTPAAFAWDTQALDVSERLIEKDWDLKLPQSQRAFAYMPYMHSEDIMMQNKCVDLMDRRINEPSNLRHAIAHRQLIEQFGRFPHRNDILGRVSTQEEIQFLANGGYAP